MLKIKRSWIIILCIIVLSASGLPARAGEQAGTRLERPARAADHYTGMEQSLPADQNRPQAAEPSVNGVAIPYTRYVYQSFRVNNWEIYVSDGDYSLDNRLTFDPGSDVHPRLNRGGTQIVFASNRSGNYELYRINSDGTGLLQLTASGSDNVNPDWSPDGSQIVFQSYRDGQAEIYIINADGANPVRLTSYPGFDGEPAWSPDGAQIAFSTFRQAPGGIWRMNTDGSKQRSVALANYAENPVWSPDGSLIAFDSDNNGDSFLELSVVGIENGMLNQIYTPPANTDALAHSWSPDGRYLLFTEISFIFDSGNWYWLDAYAKTYDTSTRTASVQFVDGQLWKPDIASTEIQPPTASLNPLPDNAAARFEVSWAGTDAGPVGLQNFDVQVKDGVDGAWSDWRGAIGSTASTFHGLGGHSYYFRVRGRDYHGNISAWTDGTAHTRVETEVPGAQISLPPYLGSNVSIRWQAVDQGGSGILEYDVQFRSQNSLTWQGWLTNTLQTGARFSAQVGERYSFRVRATDRAQNVGPWQESAGSALLCEWVLQGKLQDNQGLPMDGVVIQYASQAAVSPAPPEYVFNGPNGEYVFCTYHKEDQYPLEWVKAGYGSLAPTTFTALQPAELNLTITPQNNLISNGDFETGSLSVWQAGGTVPAQISTAEYATGAASAVLGTTSTGLSAAQTISTAGIPRAPMGLVITPDDQIQMAWGEWNQANSILTLFQQSRSPNGVWSQKETITTRAENASFMDLALDEQGYLKLGYGMNYETFEWGSQYPGCCWYSFLQRSPQGTWGLEQKIFQGSKYSSDLKIKSNGDVYFVYGQAAGNAYEQRMAYLEANQNYWANFLRFGPSAAAQKPLVEVDRENGIHVIYPATDGKYTAVQLWRQGANNIWAPIEQIEYQPVDFHSPPQLAVEDNGTVHACWQHYLSTYYSSRNPSGSWTPAEEPPVSGCDFMFTDEAGTVYLVGFKPGMYGARFITQKPVGGPWTAPVGFAYHSYETRSVAYKFDQTGQLHLLITYGSNETEIYYYRRNANGDWQPLLAIANEYSIQTTRKPSLELDSKDQVHIGWWGSNSNSLRGAVKYSGPDYAPQNSVSSLSRQVVIPISLTRPVLSFMYNLKSANPGPAAFSVSVLDQAGQTTVFSTTTTTSGWTHAWADLSAYTGKSVTLTFTLSQAAGQPVTWVYVDDVSIDAAATDAWVSSAMKAAQPGDQVVYSLNYGNQGGMPAQGVIISHTLPAELSFISASLPVTPTGGALTWNLGSLPGFTFRTITITATVSSQVNPGAPLLGSLGISTLSNESGLANNSTQTRLFIGQQVFLPVVWRK